MLRFIRSYYLYIYYWYSKKTSKEDKKPKKHLGFALLMILIIPLQLLALSICLGSLSQSFSDFFFTLQHISLFGTHRGDVTGAVGLSFGVSAVLTYFICCVGIEYDDIPKRLATHGSWLANWSFSRIAAVLFLNLILVFLSLAVS